MTDIKQTCTHCKLNLSRDDNFIRNKSGQYQKRCNSCNEKCRINKNLIKLRKSLNKDYDNKYIKLKILINKEIIKQFLKSIKHEEIKEQQCVYCKLYLHRANNFVLTKLGKYQKKCNSCNLNNRIYYKKRKIYKSLSKYYDKYYIK
jgi:hypothetical protein